MPRTSPAPPCWHADMDWERFALLDCGADPQLHPTLFHHRMETGLRCRGLFERQPEAPNEIIGPFLIEVPMHSHRPEVARWLEHAERNAPCVSWLASEALFDPLFEHLEAQIDVALPGNQLAMLRFWDPRAFYRYQRMLTAAQLLELLGPILEWQIRLNGQTIHVRRNDLEYLKQEQEANADADV